MKKYVFLLISAVIVFFVASELRIERERIPTESEIVVNLLENFAFIRPREVDVILKQTTIDKKTREEVLLLVLGTVDEYLPKSQRIPDNSERVLKMLRDNVPGYDFGEIENEEAGHFRMLTSTSHWTVSTIKTTKGHFSRWVRVTDVNSMSSLE